MIRNALIAGATGLVGNELVSLLISSDIYNVVHVITRRPYHLQHLKLISHTVDFDNLQSFKPKAIVNDVYVCLGTTMKKAGNKENFRKVDYKYVISLAKWAVENNVEKFSVISSMGADANSAFSFYLRTKGEMEDALKEFSFKKLTILRPSLILGDRNEFRLAEKISTALVKPLIIIFRGRLLKYKPLAAKTIAKAIYNETVKNNNPIQIIENIDIHKYAK